MILNFIFLFSTLSGAISRRLCICQPDRPGSVCSLQQKCSNFNNENQILLIEKNSKINNNNNKVNIFKIFQDIIEEGYSNIDLELDVFGSLKSNPIIFDFTDTNRFYSYDEDLSLSIKIQGGEWKQIINLTGFNASTKDIYSRLSLSLQNIAVLLDMNNSKDISLDSFTIQKSRLIVPPGKYVTLNAHDLRTDTISSYSEFNGKIAVDHLSFSDTDDPTIINNFNSPFEIINHTNSFQKGQIYPPKNKKILDDQPSSIYESDFRYFFCLCTKSHLDRALENLECDMHGVPPDTQHYINVKSTDIINIISKAPDNTTIRFFLTEASATDPCSLNLPNFVGKNLVIIFQIANPDYPSYFNLKSNGINVTQVIENNISISFNNIETVNIDTNLLSTFYNVTLRSSQLMFADDQTSASIQNLVTDSASLAIFQGILNIRESIELRRTQPARMNGFIILEDNSILLIPQISNFPHILFRNRASPSETLPEYLISLCDELEYVEMRFYFGICNISIIMSDNLMTVNDVINLTFRAELTSSFDRLDLTKSPMIFITSYVPPHGLDVTFGENAGDAQWPRYTIFYFESGLDESVPKDQYPLVYLHINDAAGVDGSNVNTTVFLIFRSVSIYVYNFASFAPFMEGINYRYDKCSITIPFYVETKHPERCHQVNTYNITNVTLDVGEILSGLLFANKTMFLSVDNQGSSNEVKIPDLFDLIVMRTTSSSVTYDVDNVYHDKDRIQKFTLFPSNPIDVTFTNLFEETYAGDTQLYGNLTIIHNSTAINLRTLNSQPVPFVDLYSPVQGVNYITRPASETQLISLTGNYFQTQSDSARIGPNVCVEYSASVDVPQTAFLGEQIYFRYTGSSSSGNMNFYYWDEAIADYKFEKSTINIRSRQSWNYPTILSDEEVGAVNNASRVDFKAKSITLTSNSRIISDPSLQLNVELSNLTIDSIASIPSESFSSPIITHDRVFITDSSINKIIFSSDSVRLFSKDGETPVIRLIPASSTSTSSSTSSSSSLLLESNEADPKSHSGFVIETANNEPIDLSVDGSEVPENVYLDLTGTDPQVVLDKSWNNVQVPPDFIIEATKSENGKYKLDTDLVELPNGFNSAGATITHKKQKLTKDIGFIIFIVIFAVICVVAIILCIIGLTCMPNEEAYDFSSDGNKDMVVDDISDENIDRSVGNEDEELKQKNENEEQIQEVESAETASTAIDQQPEGDNESENTDSNFFDEIDNDSKEKNNVK